MFPLGDSGDSQGWSGAEDFLHFGEQVFGAEGLWEQVLDVGLGELGGGEAMASGGEHDDGNLGGFGLFAQSHAEVEAAEQGHLEVGDDEVEPGFAGHGMCLLAIGGGEDVVAALSELVCDGGEDVGLIIGDEDAARGRGGSNFWRCWRAVGLHK